MSDSEGGEVAQEETSDGVTEENLLEELQRQFGKPGGTSFGMYTQDMQKFGYSPDNAYGHAWSLINTPRKDLKSEGLNIMNDPQIILGDIDNDKSLRFYQLDLFYLTNLCGIALNDPIFEIVFSVLWQSFKNEVRITSSMGGKERQYQAFHIPQASTKKGFSIFGKKKQRKREPIEYIIPQEEEEGMY
jgi:hypothetical protein